MHKETLNWYAMQPYRWPRVDSHLGSRGSKEFLRRLAFFQTKKTRERSNVPWCYSKSTLTEFPTQGDLMGSEILVWWVSTTLDLPFTSKYQGETRRETRKIEVLTLFDRRGNKGKRMGLQSRAKMEIIQELLLLTQGDVIRMRVRIGEEV